MGQALYRTYRSRSLSEIVGQEHITDTLARALKAGHISHAYLFTGPRGTGKTSVARILAHEINGLPYSDAQNLDIIEIDAASNRRIDDIRDLREKVHIAPVSAKYKVYIIDEVHMLTGESFNALLKTLEEPPAHVVFILATTEVHKLPATIISRTQRFSFRPGSRDKVVNHLKMIAKNEKIDIDDAALNLIAEHGEGSFRDSLSLLDQLTHITSGNITGEDVAATLGLAPQAQLELLLQATLSSDHVKIAQVLAELEKQGSAVGAVVGQLTKLLAAQAITDPRLYRLLDSMLEVPHAYNPNLKLLTTLVQFAGATTISKEKEVKTVATVATAAPIMTITKESSAAKSEPKPTATPPAAEAPAATNAPLTALTNGDWQKVLSAIKKTNAPLFAVLKHAAPSLDENVLTLRFKFALHSKKFDDAKQRAILARTIHHVLGGIPTVVCVLDKNATPPVATDDPTVSSVAEIMGGGEVINAEAI